jgi:thiol:disulfide interchange protein DsbD
VRTIILLFVANAYAFTGFTQVSKTVQWQFSALPIDDDVIMLKISADIVPGWHLYSQFIPKDGPLPTRITFENKKGLFLIGTLEENGKADKFYEEVYEMDITWYSGKVDFLQKVKITELMNVIHGKVEYMTCNTHSCIPDTREFIIKTKN